MALCQLSANTAALTFRNVTAFHNWTCDLYGNGAILISGKLGDLIRRMEQSPD